MHSPSGVTKPPYHLPQETVEIHTVKRHGHGWERLKAALHKNDERCAVISVFALLSIGVGPSSSHTVGPMRAGQRFVKDLERQGLLMQVGKLEVTLYGSLALTGEGHMTPQATLMGLEGELPHSVDTAGIAARVREIKAHKKLRLGGKNPVDFQYSKNMVLVSEALPEHPNGMKLSAWDHAGLPVASEVYFSIGGGFFCTRVALQHDNAMQHKRPVLDRVPFPFISGAHVLTLCEEEHCSIADLVERNELHLMDRPGRKWPETVDDGIRAIWNTMRCSILRGCAATDTLLPDLDIPRRAPALIKSLSAKIRAGSTENGLSGEWWMHAHAFPRTSDPALVMQLTSAWAIAMNEENACGGRVVTAPTNGSCGIIPAVLQYYLTFHHHATPRDDGEEAEFAAVKQFLLTASAVGMLFKKGASISGAEVGCQGEVGVASSMAAAGLCAVLGGTPTKVLAAAEMTMQHMLGLTCDPVRGLVQIPCIERNSFGALNAVHATHLALHEAWGEGMQRPVSLDVVIKTMLSTGQDMHVKYKETSLGGLAVNFTAC